MAVILHYFTNSVALGPVMLKVVAVIPIMSAREM